MTAPTAQRLSTSQQVALDALRWAEGRAEHVGTAASIFDDTWADDHRALVIARENVRRLFPQGVPAL